MAEGWSTSLAARLALVTALWSACALLVTGVILTGLFRRHAETAFDDRIIADLVSLVRTVSGRPEDAPGFPAEALGPLYSEPFSGWAWQIRQGDTIVAQSASLGPRIPGIMEPLVAPERRPGDFIAPGGIAARGAERVVTFPDNNLVLTFAVAGPRSEIDGRLADFANLLLYSLAVFGLVMFIASLLLSRMMLAPVSDLSQAVRRLRDGDTMALQRRWPRELASVAAELRALSTHIDSLIERSRNQTSDLAHSLKTPLSILRQTAEAMPIDQGRPVLAQLKRIEQSVDWHLTRRRVSGPRHGRIAIAGVIDDVIFAMRRLFQDRRLDIKAELPPDAAFSGDEEDLQEMLGNLMENACKWARHRVFVGAELTGATLTLTIDDDGPGIPAHLRKKVFDRGLRLDESLPGHGHGLAIVADIVRSYCGEIDVGDSHLGGTAVRLSLPGTSVSGN